MLDGSAPLGRGPFHMSRRSPDPLTPGDHTVPAGPQGRTKDQLYQDAKRQCVEGRSSMDKDELKDAVEER